jgi:predicted component of type VI protein secretion system
MLMPAVQELAAKTQTQVVEAVKTTQDAALGAARNVIDTVDSALPEIPEQLAPIADRLPNRTEFIDKVFSLAERALAANLRFAEELLGLVVEAIEFAAKPLGRDAKDV